MDSTFIYKQGSLNRGLFIIALIFTGARKPACHPRRAAPQSVRYWEEEESSQTVLEAGKDAQEILCAQGGKTELLGGARL